MSTFAEATEEACDFVRILEPDDYNGDPKLMRQLISHAVAHGKSVVLRQFAVNGTDFSAESLSEDLDILCDTVVDVQGMNIGCEQEKAC